MPDAEAPKRFSVFGDSISTLEGFQPTSYLIQYRGNARKRSGVMDIGDTWWGMVIEHFGGTLLRNDSYSGSQVTRCRSAKKLFPSACSEERLHALAEAGRPDVLFVYLGTNDWDALMDVLPESEETQFSDSFEAAYGYMLSRLAVLFPGTQLWCLNLTCSEKMLREYPQDYIDCMTLYNRSIAACAERIGAHLVDLYSLAMGYSTYDLGHPDRNGMVRIASAVIRTMEE